MLRVIPVPVIIVILVSTWLPRSAAGAPGDLLWSFPGIENVNAIVETPDIDGDMTPDIAFESYDAGVASTAHNLYLLSGETGTDIWSVRTQSGPSNSGGYGDDCLDLGGDMSDDGIPDLLLGTAWGGRSGMGIDLTDGTRLWLFDTYIHSPPSPPESGWVYTIHPVADLDDDGVTDAIFGVGSDNNGAYAVSGTDGSVLYRLHATDAVVSSTTLADINGDGLTEVCFGGGDNNHIVHCISGASTNVAIPLWSADVHDGTQHMTTFVDVDADSIPEVLVGTWDYEVVCLSGANGSEVWTYPAGTGNVIMRVAALDDVDGDEVPDVAVASWANSALVVSGVDGTHLWSGPTGGDVWAIDRANDVTGDGVSEVAAGSFDGRVYLFEGKTGAELWTYMAGDKIFSVRGVSDLSGNGVPDIVAGTQKLGGSGGWVYALEGNDATPIRTPSMAGRILGTGIELTWEADLTAPGTVFNVYRRTRSENDPEGVTIGSAVRVQEKVAIATANLPAREKLAMRVALATDDLFKLLNDRPIETDGGMGRYLDGAVRSGRTYDYRLGYIEPGADERLLPVVTMRAQGGAPSALGIHPIGPVGRPGGFRVSLPADAAGEYRVALYAVDGRLAGVVGAGRLTGDQSELDIHWDGRDSRGAPLATGVYIAEIRVGTARATTKLIWLR